MAPAMSLPPRDPPPALAYAGVGSRDTPADVLQLIESLGHTLARRGYLLRSGAAPGADAAWERGAIAGDGACEIYLPWPGFQGHTTGYVLQQQPGYQQAIEIASRHHPAWNNLSQAVRKLMARNVMQVLGADCASPVKFLLCWAPRSTFDSAGQLVDVGGGTGLAVRLAAHCGIPCFNLQHPPHHDRLTRLL